MFPDHLSVSYDYVKTNHSSKTFLNQWESMGFRKLKSKRILSRRRHLITDVISLQFSVFPWKFNSPQVKRKLISIILNSAYQLLQQLPNDLRPLILSKFIAFFVANGIKVLAIPVTQARTHWAPSGPRSIVPSANRNPSAHWMPHSRLMSASSEN